MSDGTFSISSNLCTVAQEAAFNANVKKRDVLVAVVFSVMWFESFVNEAVESLEVLHSNGSPLPARLKMLAAVFADAPERMPLSRKVQLISTLLTNRRLTNACVPFQEFLLLLKLRNGLVHMRLGRITKKKTGDGFAPRDGKSLTNALRERGFLTEAGEWLGMGWRDATFNPDVGAWAFQTSIEMATVVAEMFPKGKFRRWTEERILNSPAHRRARKRAKLVPRPSD